MVALDTARAAEAAPRTTRRRAVSRWLLGTGVVLALGSLAPLVASPGIGHLSAAVLSLLLGSGVAAIGTALGSGRATFLATLGLMLLLDLGRLPPRPAPAFEEPQALWQTDQSIEATLSGAPTGPRLAVFADAVFQADQAPFGLSATVNGEPRAWRCPFQHGRQWLDLPLEGASAPTLDVRLGLSGAPDRERAYLVVYHSATREGYLVGVAPDPAVPAPVTTCTPA